MFTPLTTDRLVIRAMTADDAATLWALRNDPRVAEYQDWPHPFPREDAERIATAVAAMEGPEDGEWWMAVVQLADGPPIGDLAVHVSHGGRVAEIGYNLQPDHQGTGYAVEAVGVLVDRLFDRGMVRITGSLHPDNRASAQVLERTGFRFEGHTRLSFWEDGEGSDDWIYGMLREDRDAWRARPTDSPADVRLVEVTGDNVRDVFALRTHKTQESFVAPTVRSIAQAHVHGDHRGHRIDAWYRAVEADGELAGFLMVGFIDHPDEAPFLWRFLVDRRHQRRGIGTRALDLLEDHVRELGETALVTSWVPGRGSPEAFYLARGYDPTGEMEGDEIVGRKRL